MSKRVLIKFSGESISGNSCLDYSACKFVASLIKDIHVKGIELGIVIGGGNILRGHKHMSDFGFEPTPADHMGILATCINGIALHQVLSSMGVKSKVMSARNFDGIIQPFNWQEAKLLLEKGIVVFFVGGTGNPCFSTDTAAALRAAEMKAKLLVKVTKVDGVYNKDPILFKDAKKYDALSYEEVLRLNLQIIDAMAVALCRDYKIPIHVVNLLSEGSVKNAVLHSKGGTLIGERCK